MVWNLLPGKKCDYEDQEPGKETVEAMNESEMKWLWKKTKPRHVSVYILTAGDICVSLLGIAFALLTKGLIDSASADHKSFGTYAVLLFVTVILQYVINAGLRYIDESLITGLSGDLRKDVLDHLMHKDYASVKSLHSGEWMNRMFSDVRIIATGVARIVPSTAGMAARLISACIALVFLEPLFAGIYLGAGILMIFVISLIRKRVKSLHKDAQNKEDRLHSLFQELSEKILMIKAFESDAYMLKKTDDYQEAYRHARMKRHMYIVAANSSFAMTFRLGYALALVYGGRNLLLGLTTYGTLMAVLQLVAQIQAPVAQLSGVLTRIYEVTASCERLREAENYPDDITSRKTEDFSSVQFEDVSFRYDRDTVLDHVSFEINRNDVTALTGISGGGKSTIFLLMMGIYHPDMGTILVNGVTGISRSLFAYVPQGNCLFSGTIAENIAMNSVYDKENIQKALTIAAADDFMQELPDGIETMLGENGSGLSEGQMQRIAIARAIYYDAPVLLLDEATSALDEDTEAKVLRNLKEMKDKTIIIVTHRKAALSICNRHLYLEDGKVSEQV
ncbi:MAG TPA: ABC transporter ATP-binding protein [Erysipelotrichaceae bacterium]|nr:ABC transporter ATP-binding protein [Erysipelotrichaceae bacterium]